MNELEGVLKKTKLYIKRVRLALVKRVDSAQIPTVSKVPFKALVNREALLYRATDLSEGACSLIEQENLVSGAILTRAFQETLALLFYVNRKCKKAIKDRDIYHLDDALMKVLMGAKNNSDMPDPVHIHKAIDQVDKEIKGFQRDYDNLSEIVHPNWAGTFGLYSKSDKENNWTNFGRNIKLEDTTKEQIIVLLNTNVELMSHIYNEFADFLPELIQICENIIEEKK